MDATNIQGGVRYHGGNRYEDRLEQANRAQYVKIQETDKTGVFSNAFQETIYYIATKGISPGQRNHK